jgi:hypothetical protein
MKFFRLLSSVDAHPLRHLSRLKINCVNNRSFHRTINLLSFVFGQLNHLSLKLLSMPLLSDPMIVSGDTIQTLCIDRLKPLSIYTLDLSFIVMGDFAEKILFKSFLNAPFTNRERPRVIIRGDHFRSNRHYNYHSFIVYTLPYSDTTLEPLCFPEPLETYV